MDPVLPIPDGRLVPGPSDVQRCGFDGLVWTEHQRNGVVQEKRFLVENGTDGSVGRHAQCLLGALVRDMVRTWQDLRSFAAVIYAGADTDGDTRAAGDPADDADDRRGREQPVVHREAGSEVDDLDDIMGIVAEPGDEYGRVAFVILVGLPDFFEADVNESGFFFLFVGIQQVTADGIAVESGITPPDNAGVSVNQCTGAGIADQAEFQ